MDKKEYTDVVFNEGTYEVKAYGHNSALPMKVTFSKYVIENIEIDQGGESEGISDKVFEVIPKEIVQGQTLNIDAVAGATISTEGIVTGVSEAVKEAGANPEKLLRREKPQQEKVDETIEEKADVVIVGGGAAGLSAALRANQLGLSVILLEKQSFIGGAISISGGNQVVMGSKLQKELGVVDDTVESMVNDFLKNGDYQNNIDLLTLFAKNVGKATDWGNEDLGIVYDTESGLHRLAEYEHNRELAYENGGHGYAARIRECIKNSGITVYYETRAEKLLTDSVDAVSSASLSENTHTHDKVVGIQAIENNGRKHIIHSDAVILASGGYGNNDSLLSENLQNVLYYGPQSSTGDGISLGRQIGADTIALNQGKIYPNGIEVAPNRAKSTIDGNLKVLPKNALLVNTKGERVVNELSSNREILKALLEQDEKLLYLFMDSERFIQFREGIKEGGISDKEVSDWLESNGEASPYFMHSETIEALEKISNIPEGNLKETVEAFNQAVNTKEDKCGRQADNLQVKVGEGPYYLVEQKPRFATTLGGLNVESDLRVKHTDGQTIPGLYAAGEVVGGVMGSDSPSGANNAWAITSGKLVAESVKDNK